MAELLLHPSEPVQGSQRAYQTDSRDYTSRNLNRFDLLWRKYGFGIYGLAQACASVFGRIACT
jgi:hypothetical protein